MEGGRTGQGCVDHGEREKRILQPTRDGEGGNEEELAQRGCKAQFLFVAGLRSQGQRTVLN